jgi:hypothetical protein
MSEKETNSVAIIEDCLNRIYQCRKANLQSRARKYKERLARKQQTEQHRSPARGNQLASDNAVDEYSESSLLEELTVKFKAPPVPQAAPLSQEISQLAKQYEIQDKEALQIFDEVCHELTETMEEYPLRLPDDEFRADLCDEYMHKFVTRRLDPMMASKVVAKVKRHIAAILEQFTSDGNVARMVKMMDAAKIDCNNNPVKSKKRSEDAVSDRTGSGSTTGSGTVSNKQPGSSSTKTGGPTPAGSGKLQGNHHQQQLPSSSVPAPVPVDSSPPTSSGGGGAPKDVTSERQKAEKAEKAKVKAQYEQLMALKKKSENHPDDEAIQQYNSLHADIQSVIDSIQQNKK